jgi:hypothetical protein
MKKWLIIGLLFVVLVVFVLLRGLAASERRARFVNMANDLLVAHVELQHDGAFTNHFRHTDITSISNVLVISGTNYQCEFTAGNDEFRDFGLLVITTNQMVVWIDKRQQVFPLFSRDTPFKFPPGF